MHPSAFLHGGGPRHVTCVSRPTPLLQPVHPRHRALESWSLCAATAMGRRRRKACACATAHRMHPRPGPCASPCRRCPWRIQACILRLELGTLTPHQTNGVRDAYYNLKLSMSKSVQFAKHQHTHAREPKQPPTNRGGGGTGTETLFAGAHFAVKGRAEA